MRACSVLFLVWLVAESRSDGGGDDKQLIMLEVERLSYPDEDKVVKRQVQVKYGGAPGQYIVHMWLVAESRADGGGDDKQLIMLEIERLSYPDEDKVVKRQAQVQYGGAPGQYIVRTSDSNSQQQVPPEYLTLLQQLSPQQNQPRNIDQLYITRSPQEMYAEFSRQAAPPPQLPRLTPEQEQMRRLQEESANKHIREQQERALNKALQTGRFQTGFQPQPYQTQPQSQPQVYQPQPQPQAYQPQPQAYQPQQPAYQPQPQEYQQQPPQTLGQYDTSGSFEPETQYAEPPSPQYYQQTRSIQPSQIPKKFSYSQVQFGSSDLARETLEPRLVSLQQRLQNQVKSQPEYYSPQPRPQPQPQYQPQPLPQPQPQPQYRPQPLPKPQSQPQPQVNFNAYNVEQQQQTPTTPQHPEQYLIETTRPVENEEPVIRIPRPRKPPAPSAPQSLYFRPEPAQSFFKAPEPYTTIPIEYQRPRQYPSAPQYVPRPQSFPIHDAPSRSAIYVQQSGISKRITTQRPPSYGNNYQAYTQGIPRVPTPQGQRALTASEITALSKAGFQISPLTLNSLQEPSEISPSYEDDADEYRSSNSKRQSQFVDERKPPGKYPKRIPKPVPLTETERKLLAEQGIRNLYRVESSESKDSPVTYVLAIDNNIMKRESEATDHKDKH